MLPEKITGVALSKPGGVYVVLPAPFRHHHLFAFCALLGIDIEPCDQGFVSSYGRFLSRKQAMEVAKGAEQMKRDLECSELYSEDVW